MWGISGFDLYFRLGSAKIHIPPLRDRPGDIPLLARYFLAEANEKYGRSVSGLSRRAVTFLSSREFPGNVRELKQLIENAVLTARTGMLEIHHFDPAGFPDFSSPIALTLKQNEETHILNVLGLCGGDRKRTAETLGISLRHLYRKLAATRKARTGDPYVARP